MDNRRRANNIRIRRVVEDWWDESNAIAEVNRESVRSLGLSRDDLTFLSPALTKDVYYSIFIETMLGNDGVQGGDLYATLEIVVTIVFTPSPSGWCEGVRLAMLDDREVNFVFRFVENMVEQHGCVSAGGHRRRQVSHQRKVLVKAIFQSLKNLLSLIELANESDDTEALVKAFAKNPNEGGVYLAGMLTSQEVINILTKLNIITNRVHASNVLIAVGTKTCKRLAQLGVKSKEDRESLMSHLADSLDLPLDKVENAVCEALRRHFSNRRFYDTVGSQVYTLSGEDLLRYDVDGNAANVVLPEWDRSGSTCRGVRWWRDDYETGIDELLNRNLILSNK